MAVVAKRGHIYEFDDGKSTDKRYVVIISADFRSTDKMVSTLMLGDSHIGHDVVPIDVQSLGCTKYLHCGMVTYTKRDILGNDIGELSAEKMKEVEDRICEELDLRQDVQMTANFYEKAYEDLLAKVLDETTKEK
jgi:mRNA-degrading endonuclease toxin of MazEF toxin-antitoxin module